MLIPRILTRFVKSYNDAMRGQLGMPPGDHKCSEGVSYAGFWRCAECRVVLEFDPPKRGTER